MPGLKGETVTKTEVKALGVDELRALLQEHFDGIPDDATKKQLVEVVDEQWDALDPILNPEPEEPEEDEIADEEGQEEDEEEGEEDEEVESEKARLLRKDLYTGNPPPHLR